MPSTVLGFSLGEALKKNHPVQATKEKKSEMKRNHMKTLENYFSKRAN